MDNVFALSPCKYGGGKQRGELQSKKRGIMITNFGFKKKYGQNFISDKNLLNAIVADAGIDEQTQVLEIGAGAGTLTAALAEKAEKVVSVEIDEELKPYLELVKLSHPNVEFVFDDFMELPRYTLEEHFTKPFAVVANLPYYITTPIIFRFLEEGFNVSSLTLMVQKEVAERFCAAPDSKQYSAVSVALQSMGDIKTTRVVDRTMFFPQPKVDSAVVNFKIDLNKFDIQDRKLFGSLVKVAFAWRRKMLVNCLQMGFDLKRDEAATVIERAGLPSNVRGESLSVADFIALANVIDDFAHARIYVKN